MYHAKKKQKRPRPDRAVAGEGERVRRAGLRYDARRRAAPCGAEASRARRNRFTDITDMTDTADMPDTLPDAHRA